MWAHPTVVPCASGARDRLQGIKVRWERASVEPFRKSAVFRRWTPLTGSIHLGISVLSKYEVWGCSDETHDAGKKVVRAVEGTWSNQVWVFSSRNSISNFLILSMLLQYVQTFLWLLEHMECSYIVIRCPCKWIFSSVSILGLFLWTDILFLFMDFCSHASLHAW